VRHRTELSANLRHIVPSALNSRQGPQEDVVAEKFEDKRINEALDLLNELAKEKKAELQGMVSEKYSHLKSALEGASGRAGQELRDDIAHGEETVRQFASSIDESVHKNPWAYLGGTALGFLIIGHLLGRHGK
jgi:ElaB/YqjD/DUF883 family membrane-anchored ribosome-binding protein